MPLIERETKLRIPRRTFVHSKDITNKPEPGFQSPKRKYSKRINASHKKSHKFSDKKRRKRK